MNRLFATTALIALMACETDPAIKAHVEASNELTDLYARFQSWDLRGDAAGSDCEVLLIRSSTALDDRIVDALQYGAPDYAAYDGGIQQFANDRRFRAVTYRDANDRVWTYGATTANEARALETCSSWP